MINKIIQYDYFIVKPILVLPVNNNEKDFLKDKEGERKENAIEYNYLFIAGLSILLRPYVYTAHLHTYAHLYTYIDIQTDKGIDIHTRI